MHLPILPAPVPKRSAFHIFRSVVFALFMREMKTRLNATSLGYLWVLFEPALQILLFVAIFSFVGRHVLPGIDFVTFIIVGFMPFYLFQKVIGHTIASLDANRGLLAYRQVQLIDLVAGRVLTEAVIYPVVFVVLIIGAGLAGRDVVPVNPLGFLLVFLGMILLGAAIGLTVAVGAALIPGLGKVVQICMRPMIFLSCVLHPLAVVKEQLRPILVWNPIMHGVELSRQTWIRGFPSVPEVSWVYFVGSILAWLALGFALYRKFYRSIVAQ